MMCKFFSKLKFENHGFHAISKNKLRENYKTQKWLSTIFFTFFFHVKILFLELKFLLIFDQKKVKNLKFYKKVIFFTPFFTPFGT